MSAGFATHLVRGWVATYTSGLPAETRRARADEIESDLWSQDEDAQAIGRSARSTTVEMLTRLVLGIPADVAWRLDQGGLADQHIARTATMGIRTVALLAISGGLGLARVTIPFVGAIVANPNVQAWDMPDDQAAGEIGNASIFALSVALAWLGLVLVGRYDSVVGLLSLLGASGGMIGLAGGSYAMVLLPAGSAVVVLYLVRLHAVPWWLAVLHAVSAAGLVLLIDAFSRNTPVFPSAAVLTVAYSLSWIAIGLALMRGLPQIPADRKTNELRDSRRRPAR
jgi:hypothetical protein